MIPRYSLPEMAAVFSDVSRFGRWLEIELLATDAHAALGVVPEDDAGACRDRAPVVDEAFVDAVSERELVTDHDVGIAEKAIAEILVREYSRRGFIDGVICRVPTVAVRPGVPNSAVSSFVSGIIREPVAGVESVCPVPLDAPLWITSPRTVTANLIHAGAVDSARLGPSRAVNLPGIMVTPAAMLDGLERLVGPEARARVRHAIDDRIARIILTWPGAFDASRALALGFTGDRDIDSLISEYLATRASA